MSKVAAEVIALGRRACPVSADVASWDEIDAAASRITEELGPIDVWFNNAMTAIFGAVRDIDPASVERATAVTYVEQVHGTMAALARTRPREAGTIVPGFVHDVCSANHRLGASSPAFAALALEHLGLRWLHPDIILAHPLEGDSAGAVWRDIDLTKEALGRDGSAWSRHIGTFAADWDRFAPMLLGPLVKVPAHPLLLARFGAWAALPAAAFGKAVLRTAQARALLSAQHGPRTVLADRPTATKTRSN